MPLSDRLGNSVGNGRTVNEHTNLGTQGMIQLCVIVEKDDIGYGLTVSGDKPVYVQSVKENGASYKAGVRTGDRIFKVNGASVANFDHTEVVNLIKAGSQVSLTLLRKSENAKLSKAPSSPIVAPSTNAERITRPLPANPEQEQQVNKEKIDTIKKMYEESLMNEKKLLDELNKHKNPKAEADLQDCKKTTNNIRKQLEVLTGQPADAIFGKHVASRKSVCLADLPPTSPSESNSPYNAASMPAAVDTPDSAAFHSTLPSSFEASGTISPGAEESDDETVAKPATLERKITSGTDVMSMEDDEFSADHNVVKDHGPFKDYELLKNKHAHCAVFLSFLISNADPAPLLFASVSDAYTTGSLRDMKRWVYEIHSTFVVSNAPLAIKLDDATIEHIEEILKMNIEREDTMKSIFNAARSTAVEELNTLLAEYRLKRDQGIANFFGDSELRDDIDKSTELRIIENTLKPHFDKCSVDEAPRSQALTIALATVMKEWGIRKVDSQLSFVMKDASKSSFKSVIKFKPKTKELKNHILSLHMYTSTTFCEVCKDLIWGIGYQGYNCSNCDLHLHKECITANQLEVCKKKKKEKKEEKKDEKKRLSMLRPDSKLVKSPSSHNTSSSIALENAVKEGPANEEEFGYEHSVKQLTKRFESQSSVTSTTPAESPSSPLTNSFERNAVVGRSESFNKKANRTSKTEGRRAKSDVDKDSSDVMKAISQSGTNSSNSSLQSTSDSSSTEKVNSTEQTTKPDDSDLEVEESMPSIDSVLPKDALRKMKPKEKKLQEVINELFYTEKSHVRNLKLLDMLFHQPMAKVTDPRLKEIVDTAFKNLPDLIDIHKELNDSMKKKVKENPLVPVKDVVDILLKRFDGEPGNKMKESCAQFCRNHTYVINTLKEKRKRDAKLQEILTGGETSPHCRRLQFKDFMIAEVQRLTKYPLLLDSMCKYTAASSDEHQKLQRVSDLSKDILQHVNRAVKDCENRNRLNALQHRLDTKPIQNSANPLVKDFKNLNLVEYNLIYEGSLTWRLSTSSAKKHIDLHVVLLEEMLVLLQVQDDGKLVLKCQGQFAGATVDSKFGHSPIIRLNSMLVRSVATDKKAFFIINTSELGPQIYELAANTVEEKKRWFKYISEAADAQKKSNSVRRPSPSSPVKSFHDDSGEVLPKTEEVYEGDTKLDANANTSDVTPNDVDHHDDMPPSYSQVTYEDSHANTYKSAAEILQEKDDIIRRTLFEKKKLLDSIRQTQDTNIDEVAAADINGERDLKSYVLASITDTDRLTQIMNSDLSCLHSDKLGSSTADHPSLQSPSARASFDPVQSNNLYVWSTKCQEQLSVLSSLSRRLNSLLELVEEHENERTQLKMQLQTAEQLLREAPKQHGDSRPNSFISNSSSASAGDISEPYNNSNIVSVPSTPVIPVFEDNLKSNSSTDEESSDDEGTVHGDIKEEHFDEKRLSNRPGSSLSDMSNSHTDNTVQSVESLPEKTSTEIHINNENVVNDIDNTSLLRIVIEKPSVSSSMNDTSDEEAEILSDSENSLKTKSHVISYNSIEKAAAEQVEKAMNAAMEIIRRDGIGNNSDTSINDSNSSALEFDNIEVDINSDGELNNQDDQYESANENTTDNIDDSDEADALSASSLD